MPTWLKVILVTILAAVLVLAAVALIVIQHARADRSRLVDSGVGMRHEGAVFGNGRDARECVDESLRRLRSSREFSAEVEARLFLNGCLSVASAPPSFCESVPRLSEPASAEWAINECRSRDADEISRCSRLMQEVVTYCDHTRTQVPPIGRKAK